jgi:ABC-type sulfate transport system permease subunit
MIGMLLTALNIFPLNLIFGTIGGTLWCIVGFNYKDKALILVEAASAAIYLFGLLHWWIR